MMFGSAAARFASSATLPGSHLPAAAVASSHGSYSTKKPPAMRPASSSAMRMLLTIVLVWPYELPVIGSALTILSDSPIWIAGAASAAFGRAAAVTALAAPAVLPKNPRLVSRAVRLGMRCLLGWSGLWWGGPSVGWTFPYSRIIAYQSGPFNRS